MLTLFRTTLILICILIASWIMLHVFALFGVFFALSYPIWWTFFPHLTPCLLCNSLPSGSICPLCKHPVNKVHLHPSSLASVFKNSLVILLISIVSIGLVFIESKILYSLGIPSTPKTASFNIPNKGQYHLEEIFPMKIEIVGISTPINAVQTDISFDPRKLKVVEISTEESFANLFIQKEINNEVGYARLTGGLPNPGFTGNHGEFGIIFFQGLQPGIATIEYMPSSKILANDGRGTNILKALSSVSYLILPEKISEVEAVQQSALFSTHVLGAKTGSDQLVFYDSSSTVLGSETSSPSATPVSSPQPRGTAKMLNLFLNLLAKLNDFILRFWFNMAHPKPRS